MIYDSSVMCFGGHSGTAFISATLALLHLNFSDSPPASCYHRPAKANREFTFETFHLHHAKLCTYTGHRLFQGRSSIRLGIVKISTVLLLLPIQLIDPGRSFSHSAATSDRDQTIESHSTIMPQ